LIQNKIYILLEKLDQFVILKKF